MNAMFKLLKSCAGAVIAGAVICLSLQGCNPQGTEFDPDPENPEVSELEPVTPEISPDSVFVKLSAISMTSEPLPTKAGSGDIYVFNVYKVDRESYEKIKDEPLTASTKWKQSVEYARGYTDDLGSVVLKFAKSDMYHIEMCYIPGGKEILYHDSNDIYDYPCNSYGPHDYIPLGEIVYNQVTRYLDHGFARAMDHNIYDWNNTYYNSIERYQGVTLFFDPQKETEAKVSLYRCMFGLKLKISDFTKGSIFFGRFPKDYDGGHYIYPSKDGSDVEVQLIMEMSKQPTCGFYENFYGMKVSDYAALDKPWPDTYIENFDIYYIDEKGDIIPLWNKKVTAERMRNYVLTFSLSDAIRNGGIKPNVVDEGDMQDVEFKF